MRSFAPILLALSLPLYAFAAHQVNHRRHADIALRPRQGGDRFTFYDITTGTTACGGNYGANDFVVAMNAAQFGNTPGSSPYCGKSITITCNGKTTSAVVVDKCPGCPYGGLDMTQGLFQFFSDLGAGVLYGNWNEGGGDAPQAPTTSSPPPPPPTTHYDPPSTSQQSTYSPPPPSTTSSSTSVSTSKTFSSVSSAAATSSHQPSASSASQTSDANYNNAPASSLAQPSGTVSPGQNDSIDNVYGAMIGLGSFVLALNP